ncbi:unnamed protein product [Urochloa humidicola]
MVQDGRAPASEVAHVRRGLPERWQWIPHPRVHRSGGGILGSLTRTVQLGPGTSEQQRHFLVRLSSSGDGVLQRLPNLMPCPKEQNL